MENLEVSTYAPSPDLPEALQAPTRPVSIGFMLVLTIGNIAFPLCFLSITIFLLPLQLSLLDSANKVGDLAIITMLGAILAVITTPIIGALSDRTTSRFGRRRPWLLFGTVFASSSLLIMMNARTVSVLLIGWCAFQFFSNFILAMVTALIPDHVPANQRGTISGIFGLGLPVGSILGSILVGQIIKVPSTSYAILAAILFVSYITLAVFLPDKVLPKGYIPPFNLRAFLANFWISPRKYPDFAWAWLTRLLPFLGYFMGFNYLFFYLQDAVKYQQVFPGQTVTQGVATANIVSTIMLIIATVTGGVLSDRLQRRKIPVIFSVIALGIALLLFAFFPVWQVVLIAAAIMGLGFGSYLAVDIALVTLVLPTAEDRAKDLGIINIAQALPQALAPAIAGLIITQSHSYTLLFSAAAIFTLLGIFAVLRIKTVQ